MNENKYLVALSAFSSFGPIRTKLLIDFFGSPKAAWQASTEDFKNVGLTLKMVNSFIRHKKEFENSNYFELLKKYSVNYVTINDNAYPDNLRRITDAPPVLYYIGILNKNQNKAVAIVGSRSMSSYGKLVAEKFAAELVKNNITVVSGLAFGIDSAAHKKTLESGGIGIVVLASGLDTISPVTNKWIALQIVKKGGCIVSEYPLGVVPEKGNFRLRNRIISGLSSAVLVIEGFARSGTMLTAKIAAEQGKAVLAIPGPITSRLSDGPNYLIQNGAKLITTIGDVLDELTMTDTISR